MEEAFMRTAMLLGEDAVEQLHRSHVAVFGLGGVGGHCAEALARSGVGKLDLFDYDVISTSNLNRQIIATRDTLGEKKVTAMKNRILSIVPQCQVTERDCFFLPKNADDFDFSCYDFVVDAVDTVTAKLYIIEKARAAGVPVISCMGTGNKLDPSRLEIADIEKTSVCPLAKVMRRELKQRGITRVPVVFSKEEPIKNGQGRIPGSTAFVPATAGLLMASFVVRRLLS